MDNTNIKYSKEQLEEFKVLLLNKKEKTAAEIASYTEQIESIMDSGRDENGIEDSGYDSQVDYLLSTKNRLLKHYSDIENALLRIENNVYGMCTVTGNRISRERLLAVPTTTKSIQAKQT